MVKDPLYEATGGLRSQEPIDASDETDSFMFNEWEKRKTTLQLIESCSNQLLDLTQQDFIILFLQANGGDALKTSLMKELFVFGERTDLNSTGKFEWKPYHYGPYSPSIEKELLDLQSKGIVKEETLRTKKYPFIYKESLVQTERAKKIFESLHNAIRQIIIELVNEFKNMNTKEIEDYVHIVYPRYAINVLK